MGFIFDVVDRVHADQTLGKLLFWKILKLDEDIVISVLDILTLNFISRNASEKPHARFCLAAAG